MLYTIILSPALLLSMTLAIQVGQLQLQRERVQSAVDVALVEASGEASDAGLTANIGTVGAQEFSRQALADNLTPLAPDIYGSDPGMIAGNAEVVTITELPAASPFDGTVLLRPTLLARVRVPVRTGLLVLAGLPAVETISVIGSADLRVAANQSSQYR